MSSFRKNFTKNWLAIEAIPIYVIIGSVVVGASWYLTRLARGPTGEHRLAVATVLVFIAFQVQWTSANPTPWNSIQPDQGTKLVEVNHKFEKRWTRDKL
ncbi:hypothetical protein IW262DRAFT_1454124 [Armillaria fumosa]|nr:hypothetical protein IW262DRAFT_1454124 [Armillaria fumosa]